MKPIDRLIPLECLLAGQLAWVRHIVGRPDHVHRLEEFGLRKGTQIQMFRSASPCIVRLAGNKVCLRVGDLLSVLVQPGEMAG